MIEFLRPEWLLLAPAAALVPLIRRRRRQRTPWRRVVDAELLPHLLVGSRSPRSRWPWVLLAAAWLIGVVALAGPALRLPEDRALVRIAARVIVLDLSASMDTADVAPSRLERAKFKIRDLLARPDDIHNALVVFAGDAFTVSPVTEDAATLINLLDALSTGIMPAPGNRLDAAVTRALDLLARSQNAGGEILLVTDGVGAAGTGEGERVRRAGARLDVLAVGTPAGAPIRAANGGFVKDAAGNILIEGVDFATLSALARAGGGTMAGMSVSDDDLDRLAGGAGAYGDARSVDRRGESLRHRDVGTWLTLLLLPVALAAFRRGVLLALMALLALPPADAWALDWDALWARPDQRAARDLARGSYDTVEAYGETRWLGAARYRAGDFAGAAEAFAGSDDADGRYNLGNALARSGALDRAIAAYDAALERDPDHADARYNRDLVKHLMDQGHGGSGSPPNDDDGQTGADKPSDDGEGGQDNQPGDSGRATTTGDDTQRYSDSAQPGAGASADATADGPGAGDDGMPEREAAARQPAVDGSSNREADGQKDSVHGARDATLPDVAGSPEMQQALEQWLRQVPDDPEGLLRRKFLYQYRMREGAG